MTDDSGEPTPEEVRDLVRRAHREGAVRERLVDELTGGGGAPIRIELHHGEVMALLQILINLESSDPEIARYLVQVVGDQVEGQW